ncbi:tetratricopeptide repeat protein [Mucilaginibacter hurinus]|uniref:Tetratricopeptide repeat protein n=2 Tax=Mucilaginibacter hurinus TaxID=2201324 RepID=A0A367GPK5_9SPHI|nr:tetratricopeptide repeat protein [Mucilaginibacter hurinus]
MIANSAFSQQGRDELFLQLDTEIGKKAEYDSRKEQKIQRLKNSLKSSSGDLKRSFKFCSALYEEYKSYQYDSAYVYALKLSDISYKLKDIGKEYYSKVNIGFILLSSGMFKEAFDNLEGIDARMLHDSVKYEYYRLMMRANFDLANYDNDNQYAPRYKAQANKYIDSAIAMSEPGTYNNLYLTGYKKLKNDNLAAAEADFLNLLNTSQLTDHQHAIVASTLGNIYLEKKQREKGIELLTKAVISDIRSSTKETLAIYWLAEILYKTGDIKNAYKYIQEAMADADFYNARQRRVQISSILPMVAAEKLNYTEKEKTRFMIYLASLTLLVVLVIVISIKLAGQIKMLKAKEAIIEETNAELEVINNRLVEDTHIKEEYIGYFFNVISGYILKLEKLKRSIDTKLSQKRYDHIQLIIDNIQIKKERDALFHTFDHVFIKIFPNFITSFNSLFKKEDQIWPKNDEVLTTDLRIFALIRLGVTDTDTISKILEYSEKTIYVYKMRLKAKSVLPPDEFDKAIMDIKAVEAVKKAKIVTT